MNNVIHKKPNINELPGGWELNKHILDTKTNIVKINILDETAFILKNVLSKKEIHDLITEMNTVSNLESVSVQGNKNDIDYGIGSKRATCWSEKLADDIWYKIKAFIEKRVFNSYSSTDWWQHGFNPKWKPIGISPLLRFMKYENEGQHFSHYDAGYIYENTNHRTLQSFVLYLTDNNTGATRFIDDKQSNIPIDKRNHKDWVRPVEDSEIIHSVLPIAGNMLIFDHRICHDVSQYIGTDPRIIIRGDIIFESIK